MEVEITNALLDPVALLGVINVFIDRTELVAALASIAVLVLDGRKTIYFATALMGMLAPAALGGANFNRTWDFFEGSLIVAGILWAIFATAHYLARRQSS